METTHVSQLIGRPQAVILANGSYPTHPLALTLLQATPLVVCCDGAADTFVAHGGRPDVIVGDGDSLSAEVRQAYSEQMHHEAEQETNDLTKAVRLLRSRGLTSVLILGGTGKREDHTLGNIALLPTYQTMGMRALMLTDHGLFLPVSDSIRLSLPLGTPLSIFSCGARRLRATGLQYPLYDFTAPWQGTLNKTTQPEVEIAAHGQLLLFISFV